VRRHDLLAGLHERLRPRTYLEIGVSTGLSLGLSRVPSIGVDPFYSVTTEIRCDVHLVRTTSDEFFARRHPLAHFPEPVIDLAFIDGMHLAEYALRDLINVEGYTSPASVIVLDDMLPRNREEAARVREYTGAWAGDVYKLIDTVRSLRPDVVCLEIDTSPTGTVMILCPDAGSTALAAAYDDTVEAYVVPDPQSVPAEILSRKRAVDPVALLDSPVWDELRTARGLDAAAARVRVRAACRSAGLRTP
jgi:hypothetical protein